MNVKQFEKIHNKMFQSIKMQYSAMPDTMQNIWNTLQNMVYYHNPALLDTLFNDLVHLYRLQCAITNEKDFQEFVQWLKGISSKILIEKAQEYATKDRLHNFRLASEKLNVEMDLICLFFMIKHIASIDDIVSHRIQMDDALIMEKFVDAINYCILLKAIYKDMEVKNA